MENQNKMKGFYKIKPNDKLTLTGKQIKEFAEYNRQETRQGMIKIEDVNKKIDEFDFADRFCLDDNMNETYNEKDKRLKDELKQSLQELGE